MTYDTIFTRFLIHCPSKQLLNNAGTTANEIMNEYLEDSLALPYINKIFKSYQTDETLTTFTYVLKNPRDAISDDKFILKVLSEAMVIVWYDAKIDTDINSAIGIGGKEEKVLQNQYKEIKARQATIEKRVRKYITEYVYNTNTYIGDTTTG